MKTRSPLGHGISLACCLYVSCLLASAPWPVFAESATEEQVKAAYLYHFLQYVDWSSSLDGLQPDSLTICVLGQAPIAGAMSEVLQRRIQGRSLQLISLGQSSETSGCHVLYFSRGLEAALESYLATFSGSPVLTVSDMDGFTRQGGMIGLLTVDRRVRFEINRQAVDASGLRMSAKLYEAAIRVVPEAEGGGRP